jgi:hypothetical protein
MKTEKEILENLLLPHNKEWDISSINTEDHNIGKLHNKGKNTTQNATQSPVLSILLLFVVFFDAKSNPCCLYPQKLILAA